MDLYLIRHADSPPLESAGVETDEERPLSQMGIEQTEKLGKTLRSKGIEPELVVASPLVRAQQTASALVRVMEIPAPRFIKREELSPGGRVRRVARFLNSVNEHSVALVGHEPDLGRFCAWLIGNKRVRIAFAKPGIALIRIEGMVQKGCGELVWLLTPDWTS